MMVPDFDLRVTGKCGKVEISADGDTRALMAAAMSAVQAVAEKGSKTPVGEIAVLMSAQAILRAIIDKKERQLFGKGTESDENQI